MKKNKENKSVYYIGILLYAVAFIGIIVSPGLTFLSYLKLSRYICICSFGLSLVAMLFLGIRWKYISQKIILQMRIVYSIVLLIIIPYGVRKICWEQIRLYKYAYMMMGCILLGWLFWMIYPAIRAKSNICIEFKLNRKYWPIIIVIAFFIVLSIGEVNYNIKGDAILYYRELQSSWKNVTFNPNEITMFKYSGHLSFSFALFASIGENICPYFYKGVIVENIIVWCICIMLFYTILEKIKANIPESIKIVGTILFGLTPTIFGNLHDITLEMYVMLFWLCFLNAAFSKKYILELFFLLCLLFTKENAIVLAAGYYFGLLIWKIISLIKKREEIFQKNFIIESIAIYVPTFIWFIYYAVIAEWANGSGDAINTIGICMAIVKQKIKQLFVLNFAWIFVLIIIVSFCVSKIIRRKKGQCCFQYISSILLSYICFIFAQMVFITYSLPRYIYLNYFFLTLILVLCLSALEMKRESLVVIITLIVLNLGQNYKNVDAISLKMFDTINIGSQNIVFDSPYYLSSKGLVYDKDNTLKLYGDGMYNKQASYLDGLLGKALEKIEYDENTIIVLPDCFKPLTDHFFFGQQSQYYYYNRTTHKINVVIDEQYARDELIKLRFKYVDEAEKMEFEQDYRIFYFAFPFSENINNMICNKKELKQIESIEYKGWNMDIYEIKKEN